MLDPPTIEIFDIFPRAGGTGTTVVFCEVARNQTVDSQINRSRWRVRGMTDRDEIGRRDLEGACRAGVIVSCREAEFCIQAVALDVGFAISRSKLKMNNLSGTRRGVGNHEQGHTPHDSIIRN